MESRNHDKERIGGDSPPIRSLTVDHE